MVASSVVGPVVRSVVTSAINSGQGGLDPDALAYFAAVEAAGGSFDLSAVAKHPNLLTHAQGFNESVWLTLGASATANTDVNPSGLLNADTLTSIITPTVSNGIIYTPVTLSLAGKSFTFSVYLKAGTSTQATLFINKASGFERHTTTVTGLTSQWQRFSVTGTFASDSSDGKLFVHIAPGGIGGSPGSIIAWGAQLEESSSPSSFSAYTESYVKRAHSNLFFGLKRDGLWTKLTELYLLCGKTFGGLTVKAKGTGALTNVNFVTGDWVGAGSGCGLVGDGSTKYLGTGKALNHADVSVFSCVTQRASSASRLLGRNGTADLIQMSDLATQILLDVPSQSFGGTDNECRMLVSTSGAAFFCGTARGLNDRELYRNGVSIATNSVAVATDTNTNNLELYRTVVSYTNARQAICGTGTALTDTDAANLSTRVNAFMTALGGNVY